MTGLGVGRWFGGSADRRIGLEGITRGGGGGVGPEPFGQAALARTLAWTTLSAKLALEKAREPSGTAGSH
jgi:hypothetical protein